MNIPGDKELMNALATPTSRVPTANTSYALSGLDDEHALYPNKTSITVSPPSLSSVEDLRGGIGASTKNLTKTLPTSVISSMHDLFTDSELRNLHMSNTECRRLFSSAMEERFCANVLRKFVHIVSLPRNV